MHALSCSVVIGALVCIDWKRPSYRVESVPSIAADFCFCFCVCLFFWL